MKISVIMITYRPGGIDIFTRSFTGVKGDYEVIVVDDFPGRVGRGDAQMYLLDHGVPLSWYGGSKPKSYFHTTTGIANACNTGLIHAKGDWVVFLSDYIMLSPTWLEHWTKLIEQAKEKYGNRVMVAGSAIFYDATKPAAPGDVITWQSPPEMTVKWPWVPEVFETLYYGGPMAFYEESNGIDERSDHCSCWHTPSIIANMKALKYCYGIDPKTTCFAIDHHPWDNPEKEPSPMIPMYGMWKIPGELTTAETEPAWDCPSPNPFNLKELRRQSSATRTHNFRPYPLPTPKFV